LSYHKVLRKDVKMAHAIVIIVFIALDILFLAMCYSVNALLGLVCTIAVIAIDIIGFAAIGGIKLIQLLM
jgi:hypothetical protein